MRRHIDIEKKMFLDAVENLKYLTKDLLDGVIDFDQLCYWESEDEFKTRHITSKVQS